MVLKSYDIGMRYCWLLWIVIICAPSLHAQIPEPTFKSLSQEDGLSQGINAYVMKDSKGFIWISSLDGINRFDGKQVKSYHSSGDGDVASSSDNLISGNFFEDSTSNLWFTSHTGIQCYNRASDSLRTYRIKDVNGDWIRSDYYGFYLDADHQYWIRINRRDSTNFYHFDIENQTSKKVYSTDGMKGQRYTVVADTLKRVEQIISSLIIEEGRFVPGFDILDWKQKKTSSYFRSNLGDGLPALRSNNVFADDRGNLWIGATEGLFRYNIITEEFKDFSNRNGNELESVWSIIPYGSAHLLISTGNLGILLFDIEKERFIQQFKHDPQNQGSLRLNRVNELYLDDHENLWVSIWNKGLDYTNLRKNKFTSILKNSGTGQGVYSISEMTTGDVLCGTTLDHGIYRFDHQLKLIQQYPVISSEGDQPLNSSMIMRYIYSDDKGRDWLLYHNRIAKLNLSKGAFEDVDNIQGELRHMIQLHDGRLLVSSPEEGLFVVDESNDFKLIPFHELSGIDSDIYAIFQSSTNDLYIAENGEGLLVYKQEGAGWKLRQRISGLGNCLSFWEEKGSQTLWVASSIGLIKIDQTDLSVNRLSRNNGGLSTETFYSVVPAPDRSLWLSSNKGILNYNPKDSTYHRYLKIDGLQGNEFNANAYCLTNNGEMWFGGLEGLNAFLPENIQPLPYTPDVEILSMIVNDEDDEKRYLGGKLNGKRLRFGYRENTLSFEFVALEYSDAPKNQFLYKMEGLDKNWINGGNHGFARYGNMPSGSYTFKVKASNSDGVWQESPATLSFSIAKPFWQQIWFYLLCLFVVSTIIYMIFQYRLQQALRLERIRVKISSDLHDDVGGLLSGLAMQSEILEMSVPEQYKSKLGHISEMSRSAMSQMRDAVWAIDARKDKIEDLIDRMRDHANEVLMPNDIQCDYRLDGLNLTRKIPSNYRQNIYLIYKEAVTNIAKHSDADRVVVTLIPKGTGLIMTIHDNGQVEPNSLKSSGLGMSNMRMRAKRIEADFEIDDSEGVCIKLVIEKIK